VEAFAVPCPVESSTSYPVHMSKSDSLDAAVARYYALVDSATSVRVVRGSSVSAKRKNDTTIFVERTATALAELRDALRLLPLDGGGRLMTSGDPTLAFSDESGVILTIQNLSPYSVRSEVLPEDADLARPFALRNWLTTYGPGDTEVVRFAATAVRWVSDEPQPGIVEIVVRDATGREHHMFEKNLVVAPVGTDLLDDSDYPITFLMEAVAEPAADALVLVTLPWTMETTEGLTELTISRSQLMS